MSQREKYQQDEEDGNDEKQNGHERKHNQKGKAKEKKNANHRPEQGAKRKKERRQKSYQRQGREGELVQQTSGVPGRNVMTPTRCRKEVKEKSKEKNKGGKRGNTRGIGEISKETKKTTPSSHHQPRRHFFIQRAINAKQRQNQETEDDNELQCSSIPGTRANITLSEVMTVSPTFPIWLRSRFSTP